MREITRSRTVEAAEKIDKIAYELFDSRNKLRSTLADLAHLGIIEYAEREEIIKKLDAISGKIEEKNNMIDRYIMHTFDKELPYVKLTLNMLGDCEENKELDENEKKEVEEIIGKLA